MLTVEVELPPVAHAASAFTECARSVPRGVARISRRSLGTTGEIALVDVEQDPYNYLHIVRCLAECNRIVRRYFAFVPLYASRLRYGYAERPGRVRMRSLWQLHQSDYADCGELVAARASENPEIGINIFEAGGTSTGGRLYHVVCQWPSGHREDPSLILSLPNHLRAS